MLNPRYGLDRRGVLRAAAAGVVGATLPGRKILADVATAARPVGFGKAKSVLLVLLSGGPSQLDTLDPKPDAPAEVRGEFAPISTAIPGVTVCEHLPKLAQQTGRWAIVRTLAHREHNHLLATHVALTGRSTPLPRGGSDLDRVETRNDFPNYAAALDFIRPRNDGMPSGVSLPNYLIEGPLTWPGQHSGFLGPKHDPWQINGDPNDKDFRMQALTMREGVPTRRLRTRRQLLDDLNSGRSTLTGTEIDSLRDQQDIAFNLLTAGKLTESFEINRESDETRDRYGRNEFGQSLLLSKRMLEAGVPMGGQVLGQTDAQAAYPVTNSWSPADICSTVFNSLGIGSETTIIDPLGRPHHLLNGTIISNLYTGASA